MVNVHTISTASHQIVGGFLAYYINVIDASYQIQEVVVAAGNGDTLNSGVISS